MKRLSLILLPALALAICDMQYFDLNNWRCPFRNDGRWAYDTTRAGGEAGGSWPQPLRNYYVFGAGPWLGTVLGTDTLVTFGYNPNSGGTEMYPTLCRHWREGTGNPRDRTYKYPGDWPPPPDRFPMAPDEPIGEMTLWATFCDSSPDRHIAPGRPLGIDVYLSVFGYSAPCAEDIIFIKYELANVNDQPMDSTYLGLAFDPDIGEHADDMVGLILDKLFVIGEDTIRVQNVAFAYDYNNEEYHNSRQQWDSGCPGAVALKLLHAPQGLQLTAMKKFTIDIDPVTDQAQYLTLAGYNYRTGEYDPFDSVDVAPADKRFLMASGPFTIPARSQVTFYYAMIGSPFGEWGQLPHQREDTNELALRCHWADSIFDRLMGIAEQPKCLRFDRLEVHPNPALQGMPVRISSDGSALVSIYDSRGALVRNLRGPSPVWDGRDSRGRVVSSGVYVIRAGNGTTRRAARVVLLQQ